ncbi:GrpB family protein [Emcibacter sp. SYSU 3D8]|uniref:GrpB family protein n=1 Tax=Emcibacter sp. SYSU 3D8 TaxID=3133969 RepID=UPI0031FECEF3
MREPAIHDVEIVPYDPAWPSLAELESVRLAGVLGGTLLRIEHVGSTSVPGLAAKPIIDMIPVVANLDDLDWKRPNVEALGYAWFGEYGIEGRRFCSLDRNGKRTVHLHVFQQGSPQITRHLAFRNYLRANPAAARDYETEKHRAAALHPHDSSAYNREKWDWVARMEATAMDWAGSEPTANA